MGSLGAMDQSHGSSDRYFQDSDNAKVVEGIEGRVATKAQLLILSISKWAACAQPWA